jgi:hypothetical protein
MPAQLIADIWAYEACSKRTQAYLLLSSAHAHCCRGVRSLRVLRSFRVLRVMKMFKYLDSLKTIAAVSVAAAFRCSQHLCMMMLLKYVQLSSTTAVHGVLPAGSTCSLQCLPCGWMTQLRDDQSCDMSGLSACIWCVCVPCGDAGHMLSQMHVIHAACQLACCRRC